MASRPFDHLSDEELRARTEAAVQQPDYIEAEQLRHELVERGWQAGRSAMPRELPSWSISPQQAARFPVGSVALVASDGFETMDGSRFQNGEQLLVTEARLTPAGVVFLSLRSHDGRSWLTGMVDGLDPGGWG